MAGLAVQVLGAQAVPVPTPADVQDFCPCDFVCDFFEYAFAGTGSDTLYKKDRSSFLFRKVSSSDTITLHLTKGGIRVAQIANNLYGTYYPTFAAQPRYVGFIADWTSIHTAFGRGLYKIEADLTILGNNFTLTSRGFKVMMFNEKIAHETVKLEFYQTGNVLSSEFQFKDLVAGGWYTSYRLAGKFGGMTAQFNEDKYYNASNALIQNRETIVKNYRANVQRIPFGLVEQQTTDLLANTILASSYDLFSDVKYNRLPVALVNINDPTYHPNGRATYEIEFKEQKENNIKRNAF